MTYNVLFGGTLNLNQSINLSYDAEHISISWTRDSPVWQTNRRTDGRTDRQTRSKHMPRSLGCAVKKLNTAFKTTNAF